MATEIRVNKGWTTGDEIKHINCLALPMLELYAKALEQRVNFDGMLPSLIFDHVENRLAQLRKREEKQDDESSVNSL